MAEKEQIPKEVQKGSVIVPERLKELNKTELFAVLATDDSGHPCVSLVAFAIVPDLKSIIFATPKKTRKYKNILNSEHVALLIDKRPEPGKNLMEAEAVAITGIARPVRRGRVRDEYSHVFLEKHPDFEDFIASATTAIIAVDVVQCVHVGRFQAITVWDCK